MTRVLVVDDEPQVARALSTALKRAGYDVIVASDGEHGVELAASAEPHLVILDMSMPGLDGLEVIKRVRPWLTAPILVLSGVTQEKHKVQALDAGADDYLQKPFGLDELHARLRALERRAAATLTSSDILTYAGLRIEVSARRVHVEGQEVRLTPTEWRLLEELAVHPEQLLTHRALLERVWDSAHGEETRDALRAHMRALRAKIGDDARAPRFIRTESGAGYRWIAPTYDAAAASQASGGQATGEPVETATADSEELAAASSAPEPPEALEQLSTHDLVHDLNNALTAMRMAVQLMRRPAPGTTTTGSGDRATVLERLDDLSSRISGLAVALESRIEQEEDDEHGVDPGR